MCESDVVEFSDDTGCKLDSALAKIHADRLDYPYCDNAAISRVNQA